MKLRTSTVQMAYLRPGVESKPPYIMNSIYRTHTVEKQGTLNGAKLF